MPRPFRWAIALIAWVLVAVAPAQAASAGSVTADGLTTATGTLQVLHADDFAHGTAKFEYSLRTVVGWLDLDFGKTGPMDDGGDHPAERATHGTSAARWQDGSDGPVGGISGPRT